MRHAQNKKIQPNRSNRRGGREKAEAKPRDWGRFFLLLVAFGFLAVWALLWSRFYVLQVVEGPEYASRAQRQHATAEVMSGKRGTIYDRNGNVLAVSVESFSLSARPSEITDPAAVTAFLSKTLSQPESKLRAALSGKKGFVWVARKISDRQAKAIAESEFSGLYLQKEYERVYPYKHLAGQLLGFVNIDDKGLDGLEGAFNERLSGQELHKVVQRDGRGGRLYMNGREEADDLSGQDLHLTLDVQIQYFAEAALAKTVEDNRAVWGGCMVLDVTSGDILAWAQYPFFNPNTYNKHSEAVRRNRLALDALEQGSTVKPFLVGAALQEGKVRRDTVFFCENGKWKPRKYTIKDTKPRGDLTVEEILKYSSNIGVGKIGLELGAKSYGSYLQKLGFGKRTGLPLMSESPGIMRDPAKWPDTDLITASFGQSFSTTGAQMAQAYLCLANGGIKKPMQLVRDAALRAPAENELVFTPETNAEVLSMLKSVVQADDGGGRQARIAGLEIGGKTGTAQKADKGVYGEKRTASFVGMVPAEKPRYVVLVIVDEPTKSVYGSAVAAPAFREVLTHTLAYNSLTPEETASMFADGGKPSDVSGDVFDAMALDLAEYAQAVARRDAEAKTAARLGPLPEIELGDDFYARLADPGLNTLRVSVEGADGREAKPDPARIVPDMRGMSVRRAVEIFAHKGIMPVLKGNGGTVVRQSPPPGSAWPAGPGELLPGQVLDTGVEYILWLEESVS